MGQSQSPQSPSHPGDNRQELINILGGNVPPNLPPHLRIEHILQQIQGGNDGDQASPPAYGGNVQQNQNGLNYQFGQPPQQTGPPQGNQKTKICRIMLFCVGIFPFFSFNFYSTKNLIIFLEFGSSNQPIVRVQMSLL